MSALIAADAETYYQSPAGAYTGITAWFCRATGRRFIFRVASDSDCEKEHGRIQFWRDRKLYNYGLRCADVIAAQTEFQAQLLRENHGLESTVVNMMVEPPRAGTNVAKDIDVLWVSNLRALKRPELALELARQLPNVQVHARRRADAGRRRRITKTCMAAAARLPNVTMLGPVRYSESGALFDRAKVFLNTSSIEGFPEHVPAGLDPRRAGGVVLRPGFAGAAAARSAASPPRSTRCAKPSRGLLEMEVDRQLIGRRAREFATREYTTASPRAISNYSIERSAQMRLGTPPMEPRCHDTPTHIDGLEA